MLSASTSSTVARIDNTGVIPEPAATATYRLSFAASSGVEKVPLGVITSSTSPARSPSAAYPENAPSGMRFTPIRSGPPVAGAQIE